MEAFSADDGKWYVADSRGNVIAGPFDDKDEALVWIKAHRPKIPSMH